MRMVAKLKVSMIPQLTPLKEVDSNHLFEKLFKIP